METEFTSEIYRPIKKTRRHISKSDNLHSQWRETFRFHRIGNFELISSIIIPDKHPRLLYITVSCVVSALCNLVTWNQRFREIWRWMKQFPPKRRCHLSNYITSQSSPTEVEGQTTPLRTQTGSQGFKSLRLPKFSRELAHEGGKVVSPTHRPALTNLTNLTNLFHTKTDVSNRSSRSF
jgi:hypothetical protein